MDKMNKQELISALADGGLQGADLEHGVAAAKADPGQWHAYQLIGDVLRSPELAAGTPSAKFLARLHESLQAERPAAAVIEPIRYVRAQAAVDTTAPAANDSQRWKLVAGFASLAAVAAIGWNLAGSGAPAAAGPQLAVAPAMPASGVVLTGAPQGTMLRDERLDALLAAHRQLGGATALQQPTGFLRNATFEGPAR